MTDGDDDSRAEERERVLREIRAKLTTFPIAKPGDHQKAAKRAADAYWRSIESASRWRVPIGIGLVVLLVFQVALADCITWKACSGAWPVDTPKLATILAAFITEIAAIAVIFVKWLFADGGLGKVANHSDQDPT